MLQVVGDAVAPTAAPMAAIQVRLLPCVCGFLYVLATAAGTVVYLDILSPSIANDLWWPHFNKTGVQTFLGDLYNTQLALGATGTLDLFGAAVVKDYSLGTAVVSMRPATGRAILLDRLPLAQAITTIRAVSFYENIRTVPPPCWADFSRTFEMSHTSRHQAICNARRVANAAFYLEALLRNVGAADITSSTYFPQVQSTILDGIDGASAAGAAWVHSMLEPTVVLSVADEVRHWEAQQLSYYQNLMQNLYQEGVVDSIEVVNALGMRQRITINSIGYTNRPKAAWSTQYAFSGFWNDFGTAAGLSASLIRSAPNAFESLGYDWDFVYDGPAGTPATALIRAHLGPLSVIDTFFVQIPASLVAAVGDTLRALHAAVLTQSSLEYMRLIEPNVDAVPSAWVQPNAVYYGGNPMCCYGHPLPYIQPSFGYYDDCGVQSQHTMTLTRDSVLFAVLATQIQGDALASVCGLCSSVTYSSCLEALIPAYAVLHTLLAPSLKSSTLLQRAVEDLVPLNISFVQWATINGTDQVLTQPMVSSPYVDPWSFFGWMTMFEWVHGEREVYAFEGDFATYTLMSRSQALVPFAANVHEMPQNACTYLWVICLYVSFILLVVILLVGVYTVVACGRIDGRNLFQTNRLVGGAWIGRPFLFVRGLTAIVVLSTSPVAFRRAFGLSHLEFAPRPLWHTLVLAGEATWVTYVLNDVVLPMTQPYSALYAPMSSIFAWLVILSIEVAMPYQATAKIQRQCTILSFMHGIECTSGSLAIGSFARAALLLAVIVGMLCLAYPTVRVVAYLVPRLRPRPQPIPSVVLSSTSEAFLSRHPIDPSYVGAVACVLSGLLPLGRYLFDVKIWVAFKATYVGPMLFALVPAQFSLRPVSKGEVLRRRSLVPGPIKDKSMWQIRAMGLFGLAYMIAAVVLSFFFLSLSQKTLVNDFLWTGFSETNTQAFLSNWFNIHLQLHQSVPHFEVNDPSYALLATTTNATQQDILSAALYAISIQDEVNTLPNVVQGLRAMDSCNLPWIATAYCYADFGQRWPMAYSTRRQQRCQAEITNGAVYLEAIFRNADWPSLSKCWGAALEIAIFSVLRSTNDGTAWIASVQSNRLSVGDEVIHWHQRLITRFTTQWQNYKKLGVTETFLVSNAIGLSYPLTLKKTNSSLHLSTATSFKMYWTLASDLTHVMTNTSVLGGASLLQNTPRYPYTNTTLEAVMLQDGAALTSPLDPALIAFANAVGPFGVVDLKRVAVPQALRDLYKDLTHFLAAKLGSSDAIQAAFWPIYTLYSFSPQPQAWDNLNLWGGDLNCGLNYGGSMTAIFQFFSSSGLCGNYLGDTVLPLTQKIVMALLVSDASVRLNASRWPTISTRDAYSQLSILKAINTSTTLMHEFMTASELMAYTEAAVAVKTHVRNTLQLQVIQYLTYDNVNYNLSRVNVFALSEPDYEFFAWLYLFEWVEGKREVVSFQGDLDTITTLSTFQNFDERPVNPQEIPRNVSLYFLALVQYISIVLFGVGCAACVYIVASHGYIEGINMMSFTLVAGHVWIGRPLMLLRGLTAISFLSTSKLDLIAPRANLVAYFESPVENWFHTLLASGEMAWLINVIHDTCSMLTQEYTAGLFFKSELFVCAIAAIWSFAHPAEHSVTINRACTVAAVDFDVVCTSGVVQIGDFTRFLGMIGIACGGCLTVYVVERIRQRKAPPPKFQWLSFFLYSAAKHKYERKIFAHWEHQGVYYLDKASAVLTGVLGLEYDGVFYLLDIKTWRLYVITKAELALRGADLPPHLKHAIPLVE
ncbi:Aste57867_10441 [Aphanomyces stellatus]|uniref:Aste57867_10441 protein n=1 Tax=Aphanomyces stellatus TaxID=120398 RepID=A0A485KQG2_9STRA|nr:hypothetical protein As57867_010401 [Aphanomyces stellatus]VFT87315.1 Aste57867_10441 [Aphanomyces stellatus]